MPRKKTTGADVAIPAEDELRPDDELRSSENPLSENPSSPPGEESDPILTEDETVLSPEAAEKKNAEKSITPPQTEQTDLEALDVENAAPLDGLSEETDPSDDESNGPALSDTESFDSGVFTLKAHTQIASQQEQEDVVWHDLRNAMLTRRILTGTLGGMEQTDSHLTLAILYYKEIRVVIPLSEMLIQVPIDSENAILRQRKILNRMLGAEIDFIVKGMDDETKSVVASRKDAMYKKRRLYYLRPDPVSGLPRVHAGRLVQARVIGVGDKGVRIEAFGVETTISSRHLSWEWFSNASDLYHVGDHIIVRVQEISGDTLEQLAIKADVRSVTENKVKENLNKCVLQATYIGKVTGVKNGITFIHLENGANAIAHSCFDPHNARPGVHDDVAFVVTRLDYERDCAVGLIRRITHRYI